MLKKNSSLVPTTERRSGASLRVIRAVGYEAASHYEPAIAISALIAKRRQRSRLSPNSGGARRACAVPSLVSRVSRGDEHDAGEPTNAIFGFTRMVLDVFESSVPSTWR